MTDRIVSLWPAEMTASWWALDAPASSAHCQAREHLMHSDSK
jgi:hypothetical protein